MNPIGHEPDAYELARYPQTPFGMYVEIEKEREYPLFAAYLHTGFDQAKNGHRHFKRQFHRSVVDPFDVPKHMRENFVSEDGYFIIEMRGYY